MGVVLLLIATIVAISAFFCLSPLNKAAFIAYLLFFIHEIISKNTDAFYIYKLAIGGAALFIFLVSTSLAKTTKGKKDVALFFIKYGGIYLITVTLIKLAFFAITGFDTSTWKDIDILVTFLPYKWILFIIILASINSIKKNHSKS